MKTLSIFWQKTIVWLTGWLNTIAFFLAGGYVYLNTESEDVKKSAKSVLGLMLIFAGIEILRSVIYNILSVANVDYDTLAVLSDVAYIISIIKAIVFVTLYILDIKGIKFLPIKEKTIEEEKVEE